jgi:hypothetical protein
MGIPIINDPADRSFSKVYAMMRAAKAAMPPNSDFRPRRRKSDGPIQGLNLPPVTQELEPEIAKTISVVSISSDDLDEDESPAALLPEVGFVPALVAGEDEPEIPIETDMDSGPDDEDLSDIDQAENAWRDSEAHAGVEAL